MNLDEDTAIYLCFMNYNGDGTDVILREGEIMVVLRKGQLIPNTGFVRKLDAGYVTRNFGDGDV